MAKDKIEIRIVSGPDDHMKAMAVRAIVYVSEQHCPWNEEFDGNDYAATQILGLLNGEPVATARIRWFAGFAKLERLALRKEFRGNGYGQAMMQFLIELCRVKGFCCIYLHAQSYLKELYCKFGFKPMREQFVFSGQSYLEMKMDLAPNCRVLNLENGPYVLNRPEGDWERPGILEASVARAASQICPD